jgi:hypothetical protein
MSMAADSNCKNRLRSPQDGAETWMLNPAVESPLPPLLLEASCRFPAWANGKWEDVEFGDNTFRFREREQFHTYKATCVSEYLTDSKDVEKFHVFARSQWSVICHGYLRILNSRDSEFLLADSCFWIVRDLLWTRSS